MAAGPRPDSTPDRLLVTRVSETWPPSRPFVGVEKEDVGAGTGADKRLSRVTGRPCRKETVRMERQGTREALDSGDAPD